MNRPEQALQRLVVDFLRRAVIAPAMFWFCPNGGNLSQAQRGAFKAMGLTAGVADLHFIWPGGYGVIELKAGRGKLSTEQEGFRDAVLANGHRWAEARTLDEVVSRLKEWGFPLRSIHVF